MLLTRAPSAGDDSGGKMDLAGLRLRGVKAGQNDKSKTNMGETETSHERFSCPSQAFFSAAIF